MSVVGLITEYNPFHKGHEYHISKAKELTGADNTVVIMSGNFVQRGTPAFMDKHTRASIALNHGADLVLELPLPFSCSSAEYFALAAVSLLDRTGVVDYICFGAETDNLSLLEEIASILVNAKIDDAHPLNILIKENLKTGLSYATSRAFALCKLCNNEDIKTIIEQPNNILAIEYLKALKLINSNIKPYVLKRTISTYHDSRDNDYMYSASSLRKNIDNDDSIKTLFDFENIYKEKYKITYPISEDDFDTIMATKLIENLHSNVDLSIYNNIDEQLANKIIKTLINNSYRGWNDFCMMLKSKNIAYTSISRGLLSILLDIKKDDFKKYLDNNICNFVRILGFNKASSNILNSIKNNSSLTLIGQLSEINDNLDLNEIDLNMINKSILADEFYNSIVKLKYSTDIPNEYKRKLIIKS